MEMNTLTIHGRVKTTVLAATLVAAAMITTGASAYPPQGAYVPCDFPNGWNSTEASHQLEGTPDGDNHQCWVPGHLVPFISSTIVRTSPRNYARSSANYVNR
jgi:hypothetical protein